MPRGRSHVYAQHLSHEGHSRAFTVEFDPTVGWLVSDAEDARTLRQRIYDDWHRVELAISRFAIEAARLKTEGWLEA
jgi:hypothetical protein